MDAGWTAARWEIVRILFQARQRKKHVTTELLHHDVPPPNHFMGVALYHDALPSVDGEALNPKP